jgi:lipopolysaccharide/colanic/teichoic acid biosynthesis glycosyltransferase
VLKRFVDIALAILLLPVTLPVLAVAALAIKMDSDGPVLFWQKRMGWKHQTFSLLKLRTMYTGCIGSVYTLGEDVRITPVGRWLRALKVDELPQLWNVLRGEMSLVGPRPVIPELALEFSGAYQRLLEVRPGLTDPASLKYFREERVLASADDPLDYFKNVVTPDKLRISQAYLDRANVWSDFMVILRTALGLFPVQGGR